MNDLEETLKHLEIIKSEILLPLIEANIDWSNAENIEKLLVSLGLEDEYPCFMFNINEEPVYQFILTDSKQGKEYKGESIYLTLFFMYDVDEEGSTLEFKSFKSYKKGLDKFNTYYNFFFQYFEKIFGQAKFSASYLSRKGNEFEYDQEYKYTLWRIKDNYFILQQNEGDYEFKDEIGLLIMPSENLKSFDNLPTSIYS